MKKIISFIIISLFVLSFSNTVAGQKANLMGSWKLDTSKMPTTGGFPILVQINISIKGDSLFTERVYDTGDGQQYPFTENLTMDGKENLINIYEMPRKSKATWSEKDGNLIFESTTSANGSDFKTIETWSVDLVNNILTISFKNNSYDGEVTGAFIFNKTGLNN